MTAFEKNHIVFHGIIVFNQIVKFHLKISYDQYGQKAGGQICLKKKKNVPSPDFCIQVPNDL